MSDPDLEACMREDVSNDLRWLLVAASNWDVEMQHGQKTPGNAVVQFLDSALIHTRALIEFLDPTTSRTHADDLWWGDYLPWDAGSWADSDEWRSLEMWRPSINKRLAHLTKHRHRQPGPIPVAELARTVERLFETFVVATRRENALCAAAAQDVLDAAKEEAQGAGRQWEQLQQLLTRRGDG